MNPEDPKEERSRRRMLWSKFWRIGLGTLIVLIGIVLSLPLVPGPGALIIIAGLAVMGDEFPPAKRLLNYMRSRFDRVLEKARERRSAKQ